MKKFAVLAVVLLAACSSQINRTEKTARLAGWVSDARCGAEHAKEGSSASCVRKCIKEGAMVLVLDDSEKIYVVHNPESLLGREAEHVVVDAVVDADGLRVVRLVQ